MDEPSASLSLGDLQAVWAALLVAEDYMQVPSGFEPEDHPLRKVARARTVIEAALGAAGGDSFHEV